MNSFPSYGWLYFEQTKVINEVENLKYLQFIIFSILGFGHPRKFKEIYRTKERIELAM